MSESEIKTITQAIEHQGVTPGDVRDETDTDSRLALLLAGIVDYSLREGADQNEDTPSETS